MPHASALVYVVDDDVSVRESLELLIEHAGWQPVLLGSATAFLEQPRAQVPACLVLDVHLPDLNGLDLQTSMGSQRPDLPIIFITGYGDIPLTVRAMRAGAVEFLTKPFDDITLLRAISEALASSEAVLQGQASVQSLQDAYTSLTPREQDVLGLVVRGRLNKQIAAELGISEITVKAHRGKGMRKMGARSLPELVKQAAVLHLGNN
ncbi:MULTISPECIES: response regulator [Stenotrophomonas]|uniref:response regulator transcription factor n=1 Tax=Stenotrophomonas TaxID=40323 RepID=UPI000873188B|nr:MULTISPECIES: response regulator [Stenotrophomonas]OEZ01403.1 DNA-binding response regulator [Stenotrophomonas sp. BIIR7]